MQSTLLVRMKKLKIYFFIIVFLFASSSSASIDFRLNLGRTFSNPASLNEGLADNLHISGLSNIGFDLLVNPLPLAGFGLGLRFDSFQTSKKDGDDEFNYSGSSLVFLLNYRLINTGFYTGPIIGLGIGNSGKVEQKLGSQPQTTYEAGTVRAMSMGVEGGLRITSLVFGGELGYQYYHAESFMDGNANYLTSSTTGAQKVGDLSGVYMKISCGFSF